MSGWGEVGRLVEEGEGGDRGRGVCIGKGSEEFISCLRAIRHALFAR